jgi:hypothetical protein
MITPVAKSCLLPAVLPQIPKRVSCTYVANHEGSQAVLPSITCRTVNWTVDGTTKDSYVPAVTCS